jgi:ribose/xylose/arabinose/galactoside ABC-type transport system permease subunit
VVIIGGTTLIGGEGALWRTAVGLAILAVVNNLFAHKPSIRRSSSCSRAS